MMSRNSFTERLFLLTVIIFVLTVSPSRAQPELAEGAIEVREAVAPIFPVIAIATAREGRIPVDVTVNKKGDVEAVAFSEGHSIFRPALRVVVARWRFSPATGESKQRCVRLYFVFTLVPSDAKSEEMLPVFRPPYEIEVKARLPSISKDAKNGQGRIFDESIRRRKAKIHRL